MTGFAVTQEEVVVTVIYVSAVVQNQDKLVGILQDQDQVVFVQEAVEQDTRGVQQVQRELVVSQQTAGVTQRGTDIVEQFVIIVQVLGRH